MDINQAKHEVHCGIWLMMIFCYLYFMFVAFIFYFVYAHIIKKAMRSQKILENKYMGPEIVQPRATTARAQG